MEMTAAAAWLNATFDGFDRAVTTAVPLPASARRWAKSTKPLKTLLYPLTSSAMANLSFRMFRMGCFSRRPGARRREA